MAKISNPRMFAGDQALATRNYVGTISGNLDTRITNVNDTLSENITNNFKAVKEWLTGKSEFEPQSYGYAYLTKSGTIDPGLIPPISIVHTSTVSLDDILAKAGDDKTDPMPGNDLMNTWLSKTLGETPDAYQIGDMIIVTRGTEPNYADALGPWIITLDDEDNVEVVKLAFPTSEIISVNDKGPADSDVFDVKTGNLSIPLSSVILEKSGWSEDAANDLAKAIYRLDYESILNDGRFAIKVGDGTTELDSEKYAKLAEIEAINEDVTKNATAITNINGYIGYLSGYIDNLVSGSVEPLSADVTKLNKNMDFVKNNGVGIDVKEINESEWEKIPVDQNKGSITGVTSNIKYELEDGQGLYTYSTPLSDGETYLALCQNSCPIYPDVYVKDGELNIALVIAIGDNEEEDNTDELKGLTLYTLKRIGKMPNA